jgi:hypothetical protein
MRLVLKLATVAIALLLAAQPVLADELCAPASCPENSCTAGCCAQTVSGSAHKMDGERGSLRMKISTSSNCGLHGCGISSPQSSSQISNPQKSRMGLGTGPALTDEVNAQFTSEMRSPLWNVASRTRTSRYILHRVFRI